MLDLKNLDAAKLAALMLDQRWHMHCEIIPNYMPPFPRPNTKPSLQVRFNDGTEYPPFLRYSAGPKQGFFWDVYGDDMYSIELAVLALFQAPAPRSVGPFVFKIPMPAGVSVPPPSVPTNKESHD